MTQPAWTPTRGVVEGANLTAAVREIGVADHRALHEWSVSNRPEFWRHVIGRLGIPFAEPPHRILDGTPHDPVWLPGARLNIAVSCFGGDDGRTAVIHRRRGRIERVSLGELRDHSLRFAAALHRHGIRPGDRVAIAMVMNAESVIAYLGTVLAGAVVVSIADSFSATEIASRLSITDPTLIVTQDRLQRAGRQLPMLEKVAQAGGPPAVVVDTGGGIGARDGDMWWDDFTSGAEGEKAVIRDASDHTNILFSSGTTGEPKAIPWSHLTPIKAAMDGHFHQDIHPGDVVAWPTNLGWMMGPWLIYASLVNGAALALHDDAPTGADFLDFLSAAGVTVLGVVPSIVAAWRGSGADQGIDMSAVRVLSSTGEASNPDDYRWLMERFSAPVIEYCGGTEIGGGYITGTVLDPALPAEFTTPALGLDLRILDDEGKPSNNGELFIVPPSIGLSTTLLNRDHHAVYHDGLPPSDVPLRRHGDHMERLDNGNYRALGRIDDTMNLGGIKVSSAELERVVSTVEGVAETAAIAVPPDGGGPSLLVVYAVPQPGAAPDRDRLRNEMQQVIGSLLNPLFRIHDVVVVAALPRTASQKVMRRELRDAYIVTE
jgi:acetyl-CoA synthetase